MRDEGIGIKKEFRNNLFQAFGVAEDHESKALHNPNGVGLGLLISNTIVKTLKPSVGGITQNISALNSPALGSYHNIGGATNTQKERMS